MASEKRGRDWQEREALLERAAELVRRMRHDLANDLQVVSGWLQMGDVERGRQHLDEVQERIHSWPAVLSRLPGSVQFGLAEQLVQFHGQGFQLEIEVGDQLVEILPALIDTQPQFVNRWLDGLCDALDRSLEALGAVVPGTGLGQLLVLRLSGDQHCLVAQLTIPGQERLEPGESGRESVSGQGQEAKADWTRLTNGWRLDVRAS